MNKFLPELNKRDDIFFLDEKYRAMPLTTHLPGKWKKTTLGELWDAVSTKESRNQFKGLEAEVDEILRAMVVRVPMDSVSGAHALKFRGFTGRDGHGVLLHPRSMRALGGADLDGDEAFVYFGGKDAQGAGQGMKKSWKDAFEANKEEYVEYVSKDKVKGRDNILRYEYLTRKEYENIGTSIESKKPKSTKPVKYEKMSDKELYKALERKNSEVIFLEGGPGEGMSKIELRFMDKVYDNPRKVMIKELKNIDKTIEPKKTIPMVFKDGTKSQGETLSMRPEFKGMTTLDLIKSGDRTATTRGYKENLNVGDIVKFKGANGETVLAEITKAPYRVSDISAKEWSKLEGWNPQHHAKWVKKGWQYQYKLISPTKESPFSKSVQRDLNKLNKKDFSKYIPDPKKGKINRPDGKYNYGNITTMEDLLTEGQSTFSQLAGKSQIWMYAPSIRRRVSENVVDSRAQMGGVVSMTQTMKSAHDLISSSEKGQDTFTFKDWRTMTKVKSEEKSNFKDRKGQFWYVPEYKITIKARTQKEWLDYARRLAASMTAFTADPMDTGGVKPYYEYFRHLYDAYFNVTNLRLVREPGVKKSEVGIRQEIQFRKDQDKALKDTTPGDNLEVFFKFFKPAAGQKSPIWLLRNGVLKDFMEMNSALFGRNYKAGRMWHENEIRERVKFIEKFDSEQLTNITAKQAEMVKNSPTWTDDIFTKIDKNKLENLYADMNKMAKDYKFLAGMMGRTTFTIPPSLFVKRTLDYNLRDSVAREVLSKESHLGDFKAILDKLGYTSNKRQTAEQFKKNIDNLTEQERLDVLEDVFNKSQDFIVKDMHDMLTLKLVSKLYDANKNLQKTELRLDIIRDIFTEVERTKQRSSLLNKERMDTDAFYEKTEGMSPDELAAYNYVIKKKIESGERRAGEASADLDQVQIDKRIARFKSSLTGVQKKLYDYLMLGTYNRNEMANRSEAELQDPQLKHEFIMKGAMTSLTRLGYNSSAVNIKSIDTFLKEYMNLSSEAFKTNKTELKNTIDASRKMEEVEIKVEGQDGKVKLFESNTPEGIADTYIEDLSGYEGLVKGKLNPQQSKIITELAENLKYFSKGKVLKLNEIVREVLKKDMNVMDFQDWKIMNNVFKEYRAGTFGQWLFKENTPNMKRRFWSLFPAHVNRSMMKYDIEFAKKKGYFKTKGGEWMDGWVREPTWVLEGLQDWNARMGDKAIALGERLQLELNSTLSFYADAMPQGEKLRLIAVRKMELGQIPRVLFNKSKPEETGGTDKSMELRRLQAEAYSDAYLKEIAGDTKDYKTAQPTGEAKLALEKSYNITNPDGTKSKMTGWDVVNKISKTYEAMNERAHEIIVGKPEALEVYKTGRYFDKAKQEPVMDWNKFVRNMEDRYRQGLEIPTDLGIDGVRQIARSMMIDLTPPTEAGRILRQKLMRTKLAKTGKLRYATFFPHMFHSAKASRDAMERAIEHIKKDSKMSEDKKVTEIKKILLRTHNLTGDWIDPGQEIWDAFERATSEMSSKKTKKEDFISWWDSNQTMGSMHARNTHIPGWDPGRNTYEVYLRNIGNTYFNQINQIFSRYLLETFRQRMTEKPYEWHKEKTGHYINQDGKKVQSTLLGNWLNFLKLYSQDAMGNPSVIPEKIYNDPAMKLKATPYYWWADNRMKKKLEGMKKVILGKQASKYPHLDKLMEEVDYSTLNRLSNLEAKWELASLLAHPKASVANAFGGSIHTVQSAGLKYFKKGRDFSYLNKINPEWKTKDDIDAFVTKHGVIPEFILYQFGVDPDMRKANMKNFAKDVGKKMNKSGELDDTTLMELGKKHNVTKGIMDLAAKFMSVPERMLRRDAFMAHYVKAYEMFDGAIKNPDHPFLIEIAKKGVKATQFLYSAPYRPAFARTALGKIMSRFQLWQWNAVRFRNDIAREAKIFGIVPGTPEYERFTRTLQMDMFVFAMGNAFAYSIFDTAMPAPWSWFQDTADWIFGSEKERDRAFFGAWPKGIAPLQLITPPVMRHPLSITKSSVLAFRLKVSAFIVSAVPSFLNRFEASPYAKKSPVPSI